MIAGRARAAALATIARPAAIAFLAGCAKPGYPPGGPADTTPPSLVASRPPAGAFGVLPDTLECLTLAFSERMQKSSVETSVWSEPRVSWRRPRWEGNDLLLCVETPLDTGTVYVVTVGLSARDRQGNPPENPIVIGFSTGAETPLGEIQGRVSVLPGQPAGAWVCAYRAGELFVPPTPPPSSASDSARSAPADTILWPPLRRTQANAAGEFHLGYLPLSGEGGLVLLGFRDQDNDGRPDLDEPLGVVESPIRLSLEEPLASSVRFDIVGPGYLGSIAGEVDDLPPGFPVQGGVPLLVRADGETDSSLAARIVLPGPGPFLHSGVSPGRYILRAFFDRDRDGTWGEYLGEASTLPLPPTAVGQGQEVTGVRLRWIDEVPAVSPADSTAPAIRVPPSGDGAPREGS